MSYSPTSTLGYGPARDVLYSSIDSDNNQLSGIYSGFTITLNPGADPSTDAFNKGINAEHVYPQSLGAGDEPQRSDMHNIFPSRIQVNEARGNCRFNDIDDIDSDNWFYLDMVQASTPTDNIDAYSEKDTEDCHWEPREAVKGDIARAMFYFYTIYQAEAQAASSSYFLQQRQKLLQWHLLDPVDSKEHRRDSLIAIQQGNSNPFILDASLAERAYFMPDGSFAEGSSDCWDVITSVDDLGEDNWVTISHNLITNEELRIVTIETDLELGIYNFSGKLLKAERGLASGLINLSDLGQGMYILKFRTKTRQKVFRIWLLR